MAITPAICVFFMTAMLFNRIALYRELRSVGLSVLAIGLMIMSLTGIALAAGLVSTDKSNKLMDDVCHASIVGGMDASVLDQRGIRGNTSIFTSQR
jgi:hypothetical protein